MRKVPMVLLAGAATLMAGGAYAAAKAHVMNVALPDGSVAQVEYQGDVAPRVVMVPIAAPAAIADPFAEMDRMMAAMARQHEAMLQQVAEMQARADAGAPVVNASTGQPAANGMVFHMVSTTTSANGCTQTVEYSSDGSSAQPKVTQAASGNCDAAKPAPVVPAATVPPAQAALPAHKV